MRNIIFVEPAVRVAEASTRREGWLAAWPLGTALCPGTVWPRHGMPPRHGVAPACAACRLRLAPGLAVEAAYSLSPSASPHVRRGWSTAAPVVGGCRGVPGGDGGFVWRMGRRVLSLHQLPQQRPRRWHGEVRISRLRAGRGPRCWAGCCRAFSGGRSLPFGRRSF